MSLCLLLLDRELFAAGKNEVVNLIQSKTKETLSFPMNVYIQDVADWLAFCIFRYSPENKV